MKQTNERGVITLHYITLHYIEILTWPK